MVVYGKCVVGELLRWSWLLEVRAAMIVPNVVVSVEFSPRNEYAIGYPGRLICPNVTTASHNIFNPF